MPLPMRVAGRRLAPFLLLALCGWSTVAVAQVEVAAGISATRDNDTTPVASVAWLPEWRQFGAHGQLRWEVGAIHVRGRDGSRLDNGDDVTMLHGGYRYERTDNGFTTGFGIGVQEGWTEALSGDPQFVTTIGWRWKRFSLLARHISNASLHQPNDGETMLQAAWRF